MQHAFLEASECVNDLAGRSEQRADKEHCLLNRYHRLEVHHALPFGGYHLALFDDYRPQFRPRRIISESFRSLQPVEQLYRPRRQ